MKTGKGKKNKKTPARISAIRPAWFKNSIGNVEAKEFIFMTHGCELRRGNAGGEGGAGQRGIKEEKWDNCNSIINKLYIFLKRSAW